MIRLNLTIDLNDQIPAEKREAFEEALRSEIRRNILTFLFDAADNVGEDQEVKDAHRALSVDGSIVCVR